MKSLSRVRLLATPWTAAYQAPPSMGFSRQESWSGCHYLLHHKCQQPLLTAAHCRRQPDLGRYYSVVSLFLFRNQQQIGSGEAGDHWLGPISVLVMSLQSHQPFLKNKNRREILRDRRRNKCLFDTFQMKGQGCALRAMRQGSLPLASACRADLCGPGGSSQELGVSRGMSALVGQSPG